MKPVNLLPASERPRTAANVPEKASVTVVVVLGVLVLAVAGMVFTKNQITDERTALDEVTKEKAAADARASKLGSFGDFSTIKETRERSVTELASKRFDWERFMRGLALVLPDKVFLTKVDAGADSASTTASSSPGSTATPSPSAPTVKLTGCAPSQKDVAATMVRLRQLHAAKDVELQESAAAEQSGGGAASPSSDGASEGAVGCGDDYQFNATVVFSAASADGRGKSRAVPSKLGGGA